MRADGARVNGLDLGDVLHPGFHPLHEGIRLPYGEIAACLDLYLDEVRFDFGKELDTPPVNTVCEIGQHQHGQHARKRPPRVPDQRTQCANVTRGDTTETVEVALLGRLDLPDLLGIDRPARTEDGPQRRHEDQRHGQRGSQRDDDGHGEIDDELTDHAGPENHRREYRDRGRHAGRNRPQHALRCTAECLGLVHPPREIAIGQFTDHNGPVDQHADHEDQREQHDDVERESGQPEDQDTGEKGTGNGDADQQRQAQSHGTKDHQGDDDHGGDHVILEVTEQILDVFRAVLQIGDFERVGQVIHFPLDRGPRTRDDIEDIGSGRLADLQRNGRLAVDARKALGVVIGRAHVGDITDRHDRVAIDPDRRITHILGPIDGAGHTQRHTPRTGIDGTGRDQLIVAPDGAGEFLIGERVALQHQWIREHLQQLLAVAADIHLEHAGKRLDLVTQITRNADERALGHGPGQIDREHREQRQIDFADLRLPCVGGQLRLDAVHFLTDVRERLAVIGARLEIESQQRESLARP